MQVEDIIDNERRLASLYYKVFTSPDGEDILADLMQQFYDRSSIVPGDPHMTHAREGAREVVLYIKQMMEEAENE